MLDLLTSVFTLLLLLLKAASTLLTERLDLVPEEILLGLTEVFETLPEDMVDLVLVAFSRAAVDLVLPEPLAASDLTLVIEVEGSLLLLVKFLPPLLYSKPLLLTMMTGL